MIFSFFEGMTWPMFIFGMSILLYLIWGLVKASVRVLFYAFCILCICILLYQWELLPPEIGYWMRSHPIFEKVYDTIIENKDWLNELQSGNREHTSFIELSEEEKPQVISFDVSMSEK